MVYLIRHLCFRSTGKNCALGHRNHIWGFIPHRELCCLILKVSYIFLGRITASFWQTVSFPIYVAWFRSSIKLRKTCNQAFGTPSPVCGRAETKNKKKVSWCKKRRRQCIRNTVGCAVELLWHGGGREKVSLRVTSVELGRVQGGCEVPAARH